MLKLGHLLVIIIGQWGLIIKIARKNTKALKYYTDGIKANTDTYYLYDEVGKFYFNLKDYSSAIEYFEIAITKKDCKNIPYHILAICQEAKNDPVKALSTIKKCLDKFPNDAKAKVELNKLISKIKDQFS